MFPRNGKPGRGIDRIERSVGAASHACVVADLICAVSSPGAHNAIGQVLAKREVRILLRPRERERYVAAGERHFLLAQVRIVTEYGVDECRRWTIEEDSISTANHQAIALKRRVGKPETRREVVKVLVVDSALG